MKKFHWILALFLLFGCADEPATIPAVTTQSVNSDIYDSADAEGTIESDGGAPVTQHGFVWDTSTGPTISKNAGIIQLGAQTFSLFFGDIEGLTSKTKYYVRAYATNQAGTAYGQELSFTTKPKPAHFIVTDLTPSETSYGTYSLIVTIKNDGETTGYNVGVTINALQGNTIVDTALAFPADLNDILPGQSAQDEAVFFDLNPAQAASLTFSTPVIDWLSKN